MTDHMATVADIARKLNCCPTTVRRMCRSHEIPSVKLPGGQYRLDPDKVILALSRDSANKHRTRRHCVELRDTNTRAGS